MPSRLLCNCRRVVARGEGRSDPFAEYRVVKARRWDCPSCGADRKRLLAEMAQEAGAQRIITLTFEQPRVRYVGARPGDLPPSMLLVLDSRPSRHVHCDPATHVAWNERNGGLRWRLIPECEHCCRWVSGRIALYVKRVRRRWPDFGYLLAREVHKSGSLHVHLAVTGLPRVITRAGTVGKALREAWGAVGGGFVDVGKDRARGGAAAGRYIGKYLAKRHDDGGFAPGFRRWSRSANFAPDITMSPRLDPDRESDWSDPTATLWLDGWLTSDGVRQAWREQAPWGPGEDRSTAARTRLDERTANPPHGPWQRYRDGAWKTTTAPLTPPPTTEPLWTS